MRNWFSHLQARSRWQPDHDPANAWWADEVHNRRLACGYEERVANTSLSQFGGVDRVEQ